MPSSVYVYIASVFLYFHKTLQIKTKSSFFLKRWEALNVSSSTTAIRKPISIQQRFCAGEPKMPRSLKIETTINSCLTVTREQENQNRRKRPLLINCCASHLASLDCENIPATHWTQGRTNNRFRNGTKGWDLCQMATAAPHGVPC